MHEAKILRAVVAGPEEARKELGGRRSAGRGGELSAVPGPVERAGGAPSTEGPRTQGLAWRRHVRYPHQSADRNAIRKATP